MSRLINFVAGLALGGIGLACLRKRNDVNIIIKG